jgi:hypothetical protein
MTDENENVGAECADGVSTTSIVSTRLQENVVGDDNGISRS